MTLNEKYQSTVTRTQTKSESKTTLKVKAKTFSLIDNPSLYRFARFVPFHLKIVLRRTQRASSRSQNKYVFHIHHKLKLPRKKTEHTSI